MRLSAVGAALSMQAFSLGAGTLPPGAGDWYDAKVRALDSSTWADRAAAEAELIAHEGKSLA